MSSNSNNAPRLIVTNTSLYQQVYPNTTTTATTPVGRSTIDDFREIVREQSFITPTNSDYHSIDVPVKRYPQLPDINTSNIFINDTIFRTEAVLASSKQTNPKKQVFNHFAPSQRGALPALNKSHILPTMSNVMDLHEDLPQCVTDTKHRAATYTSPGERIISPIKRPSAPIPPTSAQIKRPGQTTFVDGDEDQDDEYCSDLDDNDSQVFDENFRVYQQPIVMSNQRIDHYDNRKRSLQTRGKHPTIVVNDDDTHPMDSIDFEPFT
ncbi:unnamed protein product [Adineta ricciae]|uniref:Uncharacterized protein n=1 Tax=Adineta ricciae TaxID=249248 RepID=A0A814HMJ3_ADIRI|nr:unnamed protein product [Adineta ricciae]